MPDRIERSTCPVCGRPTFRWVRTLHRRLPQEPEVSAGWWCHDDPDPSKITYACKQAGDG